MATPQAQALGPQAPNPYATPKSTVADAATEVQPVRLFAVSGRIGRVRYVVNLFGLYILFAIVIGGLTALVGPVAALLWIAYSALAIMLTIQRCHDFNTTGWLAILSLVPLVNLVFWFIPGSDGRNRWGAPTPPNSMLSLVLVWIFPVLGVIGIAAAVAIPAYNDYAKRAEQRR